MANELVSDSAVPFDEDRPWRMKPKIFIAIIAAAITIATSWGAIKWDVVTVKRDVADHGEKLKEVARKLEAIEQSAWEVKMQNQAINAKLDYLTGDKRGPRPAPSP